MLELLYTTLTIIGLSFLFFICLPSFQKFRFIFYVYFIVVWFVLFFTREHYLYDAPCYEKENKYYPIIDFDEEEVNSEGSEPIKDIKLIYQTTNFSLVKTDIFSKECTTYYYIKRSESCPITNIIPECDGDIEHPGFNKKEIGECFVYYKDNDPSWKLYTNADYNHNTKELRFYSDFDFYNLTRLKIQEENLEINTHLRKYYLFCDISCLILMYFSFIYYCMESNDDKSWNYFRIIDYIIQLIIFILYLIRFIFYVDIKYKYRKKKDNVLKEHPEFLSIFGYDSNIIESQIDLYEYFGIYKPLNYTVNSFPLAIYIALIFYYLITLIFPKYCEDIRSKRENSCPLNTEKYPRFNNRVDIRIIFLLIPVFPLYVAICVFNVLNDLEIRKLYTNTIQNWESSPIISIEETDLKTYEIGHIILNDTEKEEKISFYAWQGKNIKVNRLEDYNYMNIYPEKKGKVCGKDSLGNDLYFPEDVECPINDIIAGSLPIGYVASDYKSVTIGGTTFYYTNKKTDGYILTELKVGNDGCVFQMNYERENLICDWLASISNSGFYHWCMNYTRFNSIDFYTKTDSMNVFSFLDNVVSVNNDILRTINLYSLTYQGINSSVITNRGSVKNYGYHMNNFIIISSFNTLLSAISVIFFLIFFMFFCSCYDACCNMPYCLSVSSIILTFINFILSIACFGINIQYVQNIMNKINRDFEKNQKGYYFNLILIFFNIIYLIAYLSIYILSINLNLALDLKNICKKIIFCCKCGCLNNCCKCQCLKNCCQCQWFKNCCKKDKNENINNNQVNINPELINIESNRNDIDKKKLLSLQSKHYCLICTTNQTEVIFSPCGHKCVCQECYNELKIRDQDDRCILCKTPIESVVGRVINV